MNVSSDVIAPGGAELAAPTSTARIGTSFDSAGLSVKGSAFVYALPSLSQRARTSSALNA